MMIMQQYYDDAAGKSFRARIPELKARIRTEPFDERTSTFGVAGNTFRAYRGFRIRPSIVFKGWARSVTRDIISSKKIALADQRSFDIWHEELYNGLGELWYKQQGKSLSLAHTYKLIDLYLKWMLLNESCPSFLADAIYKYGYCALDSQILIRMNECMSKALPIKNPTMGSIINQNTYDFCQGIIKDFTQMYRGTRILFDLYAWKSGGA